jgi:hypothetical protein
MGDSWLDPLYLFIHEEHEGHEGHKKSCFVTFVIFVDNKFVTNLVPSCLRGGVVQKKSVAQRYLALTTLEVTVVI